MAGGIRSYSTTPANNNASPPFGWPEAMLPSAVNNAARQMMADIRAGFEELPWFDFGDVPTRVDNDTITVPTDLTARYVAGRRIKLVGATTGYATISTSSYSAPSTTLDVMMDSGNVPTSLVTIAVGINTATNTAIPAFGDGTVSLPSITFVLDPDTGIYRSGANNLSFASAGAKIMEMLTGSYIAIYEQLQANDGTVGAPGHSFRNDPDTGTYRSAANVMRLATGGSDALILTTSEIAVGANHIIGNTDGAVGSPSYSFDLDTDTGVYRYTTNTIGFTAGGTVSFWVAPSQAQILDGSVGTPAIGCVNDTDTGFYRFQSGGIAYTSNGVFSVGLYGNMVSIGDGFASGDRLVLRNSTARSASNLEWYVNHAALQLRIYGYDGSVTTLGSLRIDPQLQTQDGSVSLPGWSFFNDSDSGVQRIGSNNFGFVSGGVLQGDVVAVSTGSMRVKDYDSNLQIVGYRNVPRSTTITTLSVNDVGKTIAITANIAVPNSTFAAGDAVSVYNNSSGALTITATITTLRLAGTATTGDRTLAQRGLATIWFNSATEAVISGAGVT